MRKKNESFVTTRYLTFVPFVIDYRLTILSKVSEQFVVDYSNPSKPGASSPESLSPYESLYELLLSESLSSLSLLSSLLTFVFGFAGCGMDRGSGGCVDRTGRQSPSTTCHPWPVGDGCRFS